MKLKSFKIKNYRNIKNECAFDFSDYTVFVGANNQGKTNCLKAIELATSLIKNKNRTPLSNIVSFVDDYPKDKQSETLSPMKFEMEFELSEEERQLFFKEVGIRNNGKIVVCIDLFFLQPSSKKIPRRLLSKTNISFKGKRGKAATSYKNNTELICNFISMHFDYVYIPAIRSENDSLSIIRELVSIKIKELNSDNDYLKQLESIYEKERAAIDTIEDSLIKDLKEFVPSVDKVTIQLEKDRRYIGHSFEFYVNDGIDTSIRNKGTGIISLITLALIQGQSKNNSMIAIEEPESHLHADSIHKIYQKLKQASSSKQVVVSTHNPSFINSNNMGSIYLVRNGEIIKPRNIASIREELGLSAKDSLFLSDNVIIVEGESDCRFIKKIIKQYSPQLESMMSTGNLEIYSAKSSTKILPIINECKRWMVNYFAIFDGDNSGKSDFEKLNEQSRSYVIVGNGRKTEAELEDIVPSEIIIKILNEHNIVADINQYKKYKKKFHNYVKERAASSGIIMDEERLNIIKTKIMDGFCCLDLETINQQFIDLYKAMISRIEQCFIDKNVNLKVENE